ncbi:MAG: hypothetical protein ALECFALPRED_005072 [Alectoria fallacina]|uniref:Uncharacterized protein n=1 Tax=Alectoria fallacina TaxID=1903189 RepID=A0A8H3FZ59_9LECA|nr:MAG: hypothetical protein ALECFALPRED_005072 [Alectoria fallacina]
MWIFVILCILLVIAFLFGELRVAVRNATIRRLRAQLEWEKTRARDLDRKVGCLEETYERHEELLAGLEADFKSLKKNDGTSVGSRSSMSHVPDPAKRTILLTRVLTPGIQKPTTDLANLPDRPTFTGSSTSGTESPPPALLFSSTPRQIVSETNVASRPSLLSTNLSQSNATSQRSIFGSEFALRPGFGLFGTPLTSDARRRNSVPSFAPPHQGSDTARISGLFGNNPLNPSSTGIRLDSTYSVANR